MSLHFVDTHAGSLSYSPWPWDRHFVEISYCLRSCSGMQTHSGIQVACAFVSGRCIAGVGKPLVLSGLASQGLAVPHLVCSGLGLAIEFCRAKPPDQISGAVAQCNCSPLLFLTECYLGLLGYLEHLVWSNSYPGCWDWKTLSCEIALVMACLGMPTGCWKRLVNGMVSRRLPLLILHFVVVLSDLSIL